MSFPKQIFKEDGLLVALLAGSLIVHLAMGWLCFADSENPLLHNRSSGQTSVSIQLVARIDPIVTESARTDHELLKPLTKPFEPISTPDVIHREPTVIEPAIPQTVPMKRQDTEDIPAHHESAPARLRRATPKTEVVPTSTKVEVADANSTQNVSSRDSTGADVPPSFRSRVEPRYPRDLLLAGVEADVELNVTVSTRGRVVSAKVYKSSGHDEMDKSALDAVRRWIFVPAKRNGIPIAKRVIVPVSFRIRSRG